MKKIRLAIRSGKIRIWDFTQYRLTISLVKISHGGYGSIGEITHCGTRWAKSNRCERFKLHQETKTIGGFI